MPYHLLPCLVLATKLGHFLFPNNKQEMANVLCFTTVNSFKSSVTPGIMLGNVGCREVPKTPQIEVVGVKFLQFRSVRTRAAADDNPSSTKVKSIVCGDCDGNGAVQCSQCKGTGLNAVDHFNGQFKAGALCWLCRGKKEILCGNCNGAGFLGGFMSSFDD